MRQYSGFGDAKLTNERFKFMLEKGQTGLSMAFDLPTQIGHDPDSTPAEGEVGKVGVSIASLKDMMIAFDGIPLGKVSSSMTINSTASTCEEQPKMIFSKNTLQEILTSIHQNRQ